MSISKRARNWSYASAIENSILNHPEVLLFIGGGVVLLQQDQLQRN